MRSLGVDAHVNERIDICVGLNKISLFRDLVFTFFQCLLDKRRLLDERRTMISEFGQSVNCLSGYRIIHFSLQHMLLDHVCPFSRVYLFSFTARFPGQL
jgi:hypothetical protein